MASTSEAALREGDANWLVRRALALMPQLSRYAVVSALALGVDFVSYIIFVDAALKPSLAGMLGYILGMVVHYVLSSRFVFDTRGSAKTESRRFVEFAFSGLVGITLTALVIAIATDALALSPFVAKLIAASLSFAAVFAIRRAFVFAP